MNDYKDQYKSPKWQKKRLEIMERDGFACRHCGSEKTTLNVHHLIYCKGSKIWEYDNENLITLCEVCHERLHRRFNELKVCATTIETVRIIEMINEMLHNGVPPDELEAFLSASIQLWHVGISCGEVKRHFADRQD